MDGPRPDLHGNQAYLIAQRVDGGVNTGTHHDLATAETLGRGVALLASRVMFILQDRRIGHNPVEFKCF